MSSLEARLAAMGDDPSPNDFQKDLQSSMKTIETIRKMNASNHDKQQQIILNKAYNVMESILTKSKCEAQKTVRRRRQLLKTARERREPSGSLAAMQRWNPIAFSKQGLAFHPSLSQSSLQGKRRTTIMIPTAQDRQLRTLQGGSYSMPVLDSMHDDPS